MFHLKTKSDSEVTGTLFLHISSKIITHCQISSNFFHICWEIAVVQTSPILKIPGIPI